MKKIIRLLFFFILLSVAPMIKAQSIIGGSGNCITNGNPNNIASLYIVNSKESCTIVKDTVSGKLYSYVSNNPSGYKWVEIPTTTQDSLSNWLLGGNTVSGASVFGTNSNHDLIFRTNSTERMRIQANGNVGIGTASAATKFHIVGAETHGGTGGDTYTMWQVNGANTYLQGSDAAIFGGVATDFGNYLYGNNKWYIATNGTKRLVIDGSGNVDILSGEIRVNGIYIGHGYGTNTTQNLRIGDAQASNSSGFNNTTIGISALRNNTTGYSNTTFGTDAMGNNTEGVFNSAFGVSALASNTIGNHNMAIGTNSMAHNIAGNYNIGIGTNSIIHNLGNSNIGIGYGAGASTTTGNNNILIGKEVEASSPTASNEINIGGQIKVINDLVYLPIYYSGLAADSILTINNAGQIFRRTVNDVTGWTTSGDNQYSARSGNIGIGTSSPSSKLHVNGLITAIGAKFTSGAANGYIATSDASGNLSWEANIADARLTPNIPLKNANNIFSVQQQFDDNVIVNGAMTIPNINSGASTDSIVTVDATTGELRKRTVSDATGWSVNSTTTYTQSNKVGIGTLIPAYKLDVDSRAYGTEPLRLKGLLQGNLTDSILSSANGVVKRLSIAEVNNIVGENIISVNATISAGSDLSGGSTPFTTTMSGVSIGDYVDVMVVPDDNNVTDINVKAWVSATNTVSYQIENKRATTVVFTNKDLKIRVRK